MKNVLKNLWLVQLFFITTFIFCNENNNQIEKIKYIPVNYYCKNNNIEISDINDFISLLNTKKRNIILTTDKYFILKTTYRRYLLQKNGYITLFDYFDSKNKKFLSSFFYYSALDLGLNSQMEFNQYIRNVQNSNSLRFYSNPPKKVENYPSLQMISELPKSFTPPKFYEKQIYANLIYPEKAHISNIEGRVLLELFIDKNGVIQLVGILYEYPLDYGFGDAAVRAFLGMKFEPANDNGIPVSSRFRYPILFKLK